jgi:S1-C subfamily serine protease
MKRAALLVLLAITQLVVAAPQPAGGPGWLGLGFTYEAGGTPRGSQPFLFVRQLAPAGPAEAAGVRPQDVITAIDGRPIRFRSTAEAVSYLHRLRRGDVVALTIRRQQKTLTIRVKAGPVPQEYAPLRKWTEDAARRDHQ